MGQWTAHMFLIFSIGCPNVFPRGDLGFIKAISKSYKKNIPISEYSLNKLKSNIKNFKINSKSIDVFLTLGNLYNKLNQEKESEKYL